MALHNTQMLILDLQFPSSDLNINPFTKPGLRETTPNVIS